MQFHCCLYMFIQMKCTHGCNLSPITVTHILGLCIHQLLLKMYKWPAGMMLGFTNLNTLILIRFSLLALDTESEYVCSFLIHSYTTPLCPSSSIHMLATGIRNLKIMLGSLPEGI